MRSRSRYLIAMAVIASSVGGCEHLPGRMTGASSAVYLREDSDRTTVWSPHVRVSGVVAEAVQLETTYAMDAWTSASIDIRSSATLSVHEIRHEITASATHEARDATFAGSYRYSTENDYESHGGVASVALDFVDKNTTLAAAVFGSLDRVGKAGDPGFSQPLQSLGGRFSVAQVLDAHTLVEAFWETTYLGGFQSSPYRWVALGGDGTCSSPDALCIPEHVPDSRFRHALGLRIRRALGDRFSLGLHYRYYLDSWGVQSQTVEPNLTWLAGDRGTLTLTYRYYTQDEAGFYRPRYFDAAGVDGYVTRDRKLSALYTHGVALSYVQEFPLGAGNEVLKCGFDAGIMRHRYLAFVGLERVDALELTGSVGLEFR